MNLKNINKIYANGQKIWNFINNLVWYLRSISICKKKNLTHNTILEHTSNYQRI